MSCGAYKLRGFLSDSCAIICVLRIADTTAARTLRQACAVLIVIREIIRDVCLFSTARRTERLQTMDNKKGRPIMTALQTFKESPFIPASRIRTAVGCPARPEG